MCTVVLDCPRIEVVATPDRREALVVVDVGYAYAVLLAAAAAVLTFAYMNNSRSVWLNQQK